MSNFRIPPKISDGEVSVAGQTVSKDDLDWTEYDPPILQQSGEAYSTSLGRGRIADRPIEVLVGYTVEDRTPFMNLTVWAPFTNDISCSFSFEEDQS